MSIPNPNFTRLMITKELVAAMSRRVTAVEQAALAGMPYPTEYVALTFTEMGAALAAWSAAFSAMGAELTKRIADSGQGADSQLVDDGAAEPSLCAPSSSLH